MFFFFSDPGNFQLNFDPTYEVLTVANGSGAIIAVISKDFQDNGWLSYRCLMDVLAATEGNISGPLCFQYAKVTNSRGWVIYPDPPSKNRCCRNVKCVGFSGILKDVTTQETARRTERQMESCNTHNRSK